MGTEVSQIACGKRHTLALIPTRGRLYAFGLGGSGQLGNNTFTMATTPQVKLHTKIAVPLPYYTSLLQSHQVVHGPWIGPSGEPSYPKRMEIDDEKKVIVYKIGAGGDQSYTLVCGPENYPDHRLKELTKKLKLYTVLDR